MSRLVHPMMEPTMSELSDWWKVIVGLMGGIGAYFGWKKISETRLAAKDAAAILAAQNLARQAAEDRENQRKDNEELRREISELRHKVRDDQHTYGLQYALLDEKLKNADFRMNEMRREHQDEIRERDARINQWQAQADVASRRADAANARVTILERQVAELTTELDRYKNATQPGAQG